MVVVVVVVVVVCVCGGGGGYSPPLPPNRIGLKESKLEERGYLMNRENDLEETFEPVAASNKVIL